MSVWNYIFDNNYRQRSDIEDLKDSARRAARMDARRSQATESRLEELEQEVGELTLLCRSLLTVLREKGVVDPDALAQTMRAIDLEDGVEDGRVTRRRPDPPKPPPPARRSRLP